MVNNRSAGTRLTVWDVLHYLDTGWSSPALAETLPLSAAQVGAIAQYLAAHQEELRVVQRQIEARQARGHPPAMTATLTRNRTKVQAWLKQQHETKVAAQSL